MSKELLGKILSKFVKGLSVEQLSFRHMLSGVVEFGHVVFSETAIQQALSETGAPVYGEVRRAEADTLQIHIPWAQLTKRSTRVSIDKMNIEILLHSAEELRKVLDSPEVDPREVSGLAADCPDDFTKFLLEQKTRLLNVAAKRRKRLDAVQLQPRKISASMKEGIRFSIRKLTIKFFCASPTSETSSAELQGALKSIQPVSMVEAEDVTFSPCTTSGRPTMDLAEAQGCEHQAPEVPDLPDGLRVWAYRKKLRAEVVKISLASDSGDEFRRVALLKQPAAIICNFEPCKLAPKKHLFLDGTLGRFLGETRHILLQGEDFLSSQAHGSQADSSLNPNVFKMECTTADLVAMLKLFVQFKTAHESVRAWKRRLPWKDDFASLGEKIHTMQPPSTSSTSIAQTDTNVEFEEELHSFVAQARRSAKSSKVTEHDTNCPLDSNRGAAQPRIPWTKRFAAKCRRMRLDCIGITEQSYQDEELIMEDWFLLRGKFKMLRDSWLERRCTLSLLQDRRSAVLRYYQSCARRRASVGPEDRWRLLGEIHLAQGCGSHLSSFSDLQTPWANDFPHGFAIAVGDGVYAGRVFFFASEEGHKANRWYDALEEVLYGRNCKDEDPVETLEAFLSEVHTESFGDELEFSSPSSRCRGSHKRRSLESMKSFHLALNSDSDLCAPDDPDEFISADDEEIEDQAFVTPKSSADEAISNMQTPCNAQKVMSSVSLASFRQHVRKEISRAVCSTFRLVLDIGQSDSKDDAPSKKICFSCEGVQASKVDTGHHSAAEYFALAKIAGKAILETSLDGAAANLYRAKPESQVTNGTANVLFAGNMSGGPPILCDALPRNEAYHFKSQHMAGMHLNEDAAGGMMVEGWLRRWKASLDNDTIKDLANVAKELKRTMKEATPPPAGDTTGPPKQAPSVKLRMHNMALELPMPGFPAASIRVQLEEELSIDSMLSAAEAYLNRTNHQFFSTDF